MAAALTNRWTTNFGQFFRSRRGFNRSQHQLVKAILETLETRTLLSTYVVDTLADNGGSGTGLTGPLRWAIAQADDAGGDQTITFDPSLTAEGPATITLNGTALTLDDPFGTLTIQGPTNNPLTIDAQGESGAFVIDSGSMAEIDGLTISDGKSSDGGGIDNQGTLTINNSTISGNSAGVGGGIYNDGYLSITGSTVTYNTAAGDSANFASRTRQFPARRRLGNAAAVEDLGHVSSGYGGGIGSQGTLTITNSTISGNTAVGDGGAIYIYNHGTLYITGSTINGNSAENNGGGIFGRENNNLTITSSTISGNSASGIGGGIYLSSYDLPGNDNLTVTDSIISGNSTDLCGGGIYSLYGTVTVTDSTLSGNTAGSGGGGAFNLAGTMTISSSTLNDNSSYYGGGIVNTQANSDGILTVDNCTISNNTASSIRGGGICNFSDLTLINSTLSGNSAAAGPGGGIDNIYGGAANVTDCTISGNTAASDGGGVYGSAALYGSIVAVNEPDDLSGDADTGTYNLIGDGSGGLSSDITDYNIQGTAESTVDPMLASLNNYGGPTQTMPLLPGSPAFDKGGNFNDTGGNLIDFDQRGFPRPQGAAPDIGADESQNIPTIPTDLSATVSNPDEIDLSWFDDDQNVVGYTVWVSTAGSSFSQLQSVSADQLTYAATNLNPDTPYTFEITADSVDARSSPSPTITATPISSTLTINGSAPVAQGDPFVVNLSSAAIDNLSWPVDYWLVDWNDGNTPDNVPANGDIVPDSHTFTDGISVATVSVTAVDTHGNTFVLPPVIIDGPNLDVEAQDISAVAGQSFSGLLATVTPTGLIDASDLSATIDWGDGVVSAGTLVDNGNGTYDVTGTHTYTTPDTAPLIVNVGYAFGDPASGEGTATITNPGPTVAQAAQATVSDDGTYVALSVLGADTAGEDQLTYSWNATADNSANTVTFDDNDDNDAKNTVAELSAADTYDFTVTITNADGNFITSDVPITVIQQFSDISVTASSQTVADGNTQQVTATALDQFGTPLNDQPDDISWAVTSGPGSVDQTGLYTAPADAVDTAVVTASDAGIQSSISLSVTSVAFAATAVSDTEIDLTIPPSAPGTSQELEEMGPNDENFQTIHIPSETISPNVYPIINLMPDNSYTFRLRITEDDLVSYSDPVGATTSGSTGVPPADFDFSPQSTASFHYYSYSHRHFLDPELGDVYYTDTYSATELTDATYGLNLGSWAGYGSYDYESQITNNHESQSQNYSTHDAFLSLDIGLAPNGSPLPIEATGYSSDDPIYTMFSSSWTGGSYITQSYEYFYEIAYGWQSYTTFTIFNFNVNNSSSTGSAPVSPPVAPANLSATPVADSSGDSVRLVWDNTPDNEDGYYVERSTDGGNTYSTIGQTDEDVTSYVDTNLQGGPDYTYKVVAFNSGGNSPDSNSAEADFPAMPTGLVAALNLQAQTVNLTWNDTPTATTGFEIQWSSDGTNFYTIDTVPAEQGQTSYSYTDDSPDLAQENYYQVVAYENPLTSDSDELESDPSTAQEAKVIAPPIAVDDDNGAENDDGTFAPYTTSIGGVLVVSDTNGVLANDYDPQGLTLFGLLLYPARQRRGERGFPRRFHLHTRL